MNFNDQMKDLPLTGITYFVIRGHVGAILYEITHFDMDFNKIRYTGLFSHKNKLVKVRKLYSQNFSIYDPLKSEVIIKWCKPGHLLLILK